MKEFVHDEVQTSDTARNLPLGAGIRADEGCCGYGLFQGPAGEEHEAVSQETTTNGDPRVGLANRRTKMASFRTALALDRTTLAWVRTTLTMASFGFGMVAFFRTLRHSSPNAQTLRLHEGAITFGLSLMVLGLLATVLAGLSHWFTLRRLLRGQAPVLSPWPLSIAVALLLAVISFVGLWILFDQ